MDGYEQLRDAFAALSISLFAGTVDGPETTAEVATTLGFHVAHSMTRSQGDAIGAWWDESRDFIQPTEFILSAEGTVLASTYSNSPVGRMAPNEVLRLAQMFAT